MRQMYGYLYVGIRLENNVEFVSGFAGYKLELMHILNRSTDWTELHKTACSHSRDDSYMYGSRLELPRVLNTAARAYNARN